MDQHTVTVTNALYIKAVGLYAALHILMIIGVAFAATYLGVTVPPGFSTAAPLIAAYCAALFFVKRVRRAPVRKETLILSAGSLVCYVLIIQIMQAYAGVPFIPVVLIAQLITGFVIFYLMYGFVARKYHPKTLRPSQMPAEQTQEKL